jgi:hypothetical protein
LILTVLPFMNIVNFGLTAECGSPLICAACKWIIATASVPFHTDAGSTQAVAYETGAK